MDEPNPLDIFVTATPLNPNINFSSFFALWRDLPETDRSPTWQAGPYATLIDDQTAGLSAKDRLTLDVAIGDFLTALESLNNTLNALPDATIIRVSSSTTITVAAFKLKLKSIEKFVITSKTYPPGYGGANLKTKV